MTCFLAWTLPRKGNDRSYCRRALLATHRATICSGRLGIKLAAGARKPIVVSVNASGHVPVIHYPPGQQGKDPSFGIAVIGSQTRMHPDHLRMFGIQPVDELLLHCCLYLHGPVSAIEHAGHALCHIARAPPPETWRCHRAPTRYPAPSCKTSWGNLISKRPNTRSDYRPPTRPSIWRGFVGSAL